MSVAQVLYEQYKVLPKNIQEELYVLISKGMKEEGELTQNRVEAPKKSIHELLTEMENAAEKHMKENNISLDDINAAIDEMNNGSRTEYLKKIRKKDRV